MRVEPHSMPRRGNLPLLNFAVGWKYCVSAMANTMVDCHRIAQKVCGYQHGNGCNSSQ